MDRNTPEQTGEDIAEITAELTETENQRLSTVLVEIFRWTTEPQQNGVTPGNANDYRTRVALRTTALYRCLCPQTSPHESLTELGNALGVSRAVASFHAKRAKNRIAKGFDLSRN